MELVRPPTQSPRAAGATAAPRRRARWTAAFALAAVAPLAAVLAGSPPAGRGFVPELGSALGIVALALLALQLLLPARLAPVTRPLGAEVAIRLHRHLADVLVAAIAVHVALVLVADPARLALLDPLGAPWRARAAVASCAALAALVASSLLRRRLRLPYARWRGLHLALGIAALGFGALHAAGVDRYLTAPAGALVALPAAAGVLALVDLRLLRPRRLARRAYVIERVEPRGGGAVTLALRADGHRGRRFRPGQFAWMKLADAPCALAEHPFSYSSSAADPERPEFTIKAYGGFSRRVAGLRPGTRVLLDGPHGSYRTRAGAEHLVLIGGGMGIAPIISLLRSAADAGDRRSYTVIYGSVRWEHAVFREELERLAGLIRLDVVHVLAQPEPGWAGPRGHIDGELLAHHLPLDLSGANVFVCGPPRMLTLTLAGLARLGVPAWQIHAERFVCV